MEQLYTRWKVQADFEHPENTKVPLPEYPRPQMRRQEYQILNGIWSYAITGEDERPSAWDGKILVPFSPETALSGVGRTCSPASSFIMNEASGRFLHRPTPAFCSISEPWTRGAMCG